MRSASVRFLPWLGGYDKLEVTRLFRDMRQDLIVFAAYVLLALVMSWPVVPRIATHLTGQGLDLWVHRWNLWWLKTCFLEGQSPFYTDYIFHPHGTSMIYHNFAWVHFFAWLPLQAFIGAVAAFNVVVLAMFALSGYTMFLLARDVTGDAWAGFVAGVIFAFWPYTQSHFDHLNFRSVPWFPLTLFFLRRLFQQERWRGVIGLTLAVTLTGLMRWQLLTVEALLVGAYLVYHWMRYRDTRGWRRQLFQVTVAGAVSFLLLLPLLAPMLLDLVQGGVSSEVMIDEQMWAQTDLVAYVLPGRYHPLWGDAVWPWYENLMVNKVYVAFVGYVPLALVLLALFRSRRETLFWGSLGLAFVLLALGPVLRVNGHLIEWLPMPYRLVGQLLPIRAWRKPDRFNIALGLPFGVLAALGVQCIRRLTRRAGDVLAALIVGLILLEYWVYPFHTVHVDVPEWYHQLRVNADRFAILDLPIDPLTFDKKYMSYQTVHGKPLVGGKISRPTSETFRFIRGHPFLQSLYQKNEMDPALGDVSRQLAYLAENDVRYIVLHKQNLSAEKLARWQEWFVSDAVYESEGLAVYHTQPRLGRDFQLAYQLNESLGLIGYSVSPTITQQGATIFIDARWGSRAPVARKLKVAFSLVSAAGETVQSVAMPLYRDWPSDEWPADAVVRAQYPLQIDSFVPAGCLSLYVTLIDNEGDVVGQPAKLETLTVGALPRYFETPSMEYTVNASFGSDVELLGYDLRQEEAAIDITLHWRANNQMEVAYKFFVHLYSPDGEVVAQADVMPRDWTYPTTWWEEGEIVSDEVSLSLEEVQAGRYLLGLGVYDPGTGERLPVTNFAGVLESSDGRLTLPPVIKR